MTRPVQHFTEEYLAHCAQMTPEQIVQFLEDFAKIAAAGQANLATNGPRKAISLRVPVHVLEAFKQKAAAQGVPYQRVIQRLMAQWVREG